jgi:hypothetical protein
MLHNSWEFWINIMLITTFNWRLIKHVQWNIYNILCFTWRGFMLVKILKCTDHSEAADVPAAHINPYPANVENRVSS